MKIYEKDFHCFACGANGDIFTFMQRFYGISFKDAFKELGGAYEKPSFHSNLAIYKAKKQREMREKKEAQNREAKRRNIELVDTYRDLLLLSEPLSDIWCDCYNKLQLELYHHEILSGGGNGVT